jgi:type I restriction enzyme S subunit
MRENNLLSLSYGRIVRKDIDTAEGLLPESFETYQIIEPGNIVMRLTDLQNDKRSLREGLVRERGIITSAYDALEVGRGHDPRFWAYALLALDLAKYYYSLGGGVRQSIKFDDFPNEWISAPALGVQEILADFLDRETSRIDQLIEKKKRMMQLLEEKLSSQHATLILGGPQVHNEHVRDRWLSFMPDHWQPKTLMQLVSFRGGATPSKDRADFWSGDIPWVSPKDMKRDMIEDAEDHINEAAVAASSVSKLPRGSVLIVTRGMILARAVPVALTKAVVTINQDMKALLPKRDISGDYLLCLLQGLETVLLSFVEEAAHGTKKLRTERLFKARFPIPPRNEQDRIAGQVFALRAKTSGTIFAIEESIHGLREFRAALITAAVIGQVDVTTWHKRGSTDRRLDAIGAR